MTTTGQVLPSVAHELNNSLQIIAGMVEILGLRGQLPRRSRRQGPEDRRAGDARRRACCAIWWPSPAATPRCARSICIRRSNAPRGCGATTSHAGGVTVHVTRAAGRLAGREGRQPGRGAGAREPDPQRRGIGRARRTCARFASSCGARTASCTARSSDSGPGLSTPTPCRGRDAVLHDEGRRRGGAGPGGGATARGAGRGRLDVEGPARGARSASAVGGGRRQVSA